MNNTSNDTTQAMIELGAEAFRNGLPKVPNQDSALMMFTRGETPKNVLRMCREWITGWDTEHSKAAITKLAQKKK